MGAFDHLEWTYDGAFEQLFDLGRGEFEQKFSKNSNARGLPAGGMLKLRFDWYIITRDISRDISGRVFDIVRNGSERAVFHFVPLFLAKYSAKIANQKK